MTDKTFREIMDEILGILSRARLDETTYFALAALLAMLEARYDLDRRKEGPG